MQKLTKCEAQALAEILERVVDSMEEYDEGCFSSSEDLLIAMDQERLSQCKAALAKLMGIRK